MSINENAHDLPWNQIEKFWFYDDLKFGGHRSPIKVPTLKEWLSEFGDDSRLKLIWLDVKVRADRIPIIAKALSNLIPNHLVPKIQFSASKDGKHVSEYKQ